MALPDLTGEKVNDTYQRLLQKSSNGQIVDGTGSAFTPTSLTIDNTIVVPNPGTGATSSIAVTVDGNQKFVLDGTVTASLNLNSGDSYKFDQSNGTNDGHPFAFIISGSETSYTTGVTTVGTAGNAGSYVQISITDDTPNLIYYCTVHGTGMGGGAVLTILKGSTTIAGLLEVTGSTKLQGDLTSTGAISASSYLGLPTGIISGSRQLPTGVVSGSNQINEMTLNASGSFSGSFQGDGGDLTGIISPNTGLSDGGVLTTVSIKGVNFAVGAQSSSFGNTTIVGSLSVNGTSRTLFTSASFVYTGDNVTQVTQSYDAGTQQITDITYTGDNPQTIAITGSDGVNKLYTVFYTGENITEIRVT